LHPTNLPSSIVNARLRHTLFRNKHPLLHPFGVAEKAKRSHLCNDVSLAR